MITGVGKPRVLSSSQLVELSAGLPDVVLKEGLNWTNITFQGKGFAWVNHPENRAMIKAHHDEREALLATAPAVYEAGWATNSSAWVSVRLELADPEEVFELLEEAWRMTATKRAIKAYDEARGLSQSSGPGGPPDRKTSLISDRSSMLTITMERLAGQSPDEKEDHQDNHDSGSISTGLKRNEHQLHFSAPRPTPRFQNRIGRHRPRRLS
jgi:hypothetical protein